MSRVANELRGEISSLTQLLTEKGLVRASNSAHTKNNGGIFEVGWSKDGVNIAPALKNVPYKEVYKYLLNEGQYNFVLNDGGLVQLLYKFEGEVLKEQRVCYFPVPNEPEFFTENEEYEIDEEDSEFDTSGEINFSYTELPLIRIDYSPSQHKPIMHSSTHIHLGHTKDCRIPASGPIAPYVFVQFILRSFYSVVITPELERALTNNRRFAGSLVELEKDTVHFNVPVL